MSSMDSSTNNLTLEELEELLTLDLTSEERRAVISEINRLQSRASTTLGSSPVRQTVECTP